MTLLSIGPLIFEKAIYAHTNEVTYNFKKYFRTNTIIFYLDKMENSKEKP